MNRVELEAKLRGEGFKHAYYSLDGTLPAYEGYVLVNVHGTWIIQYFERGETRELARFSSEAEACKDFYDRLASDAVIRPGTSQTRG